MATQFKDKLHSSNFFISLSQIKYMFYIEIFT